MKILITGADSFIGRNLKAELINRNYNEMLEIDDCGDAERLRRHVDESDLIFHLQTLYRSDDEAAFERINTGTTKTIIELIGSRKKDLIYVSSTQAENLNPYGISKRKAEEMIEEWAESTGNKACIVRLANEFGKWCPPNLNSVVATFCDNIAVEKEVQINNPDTPLKLVYIDDIIDGLLHTLQEDCPMYAGINPAYDTTVGRLAETIKGFHADRKAGNVPDTGDDLTKKLYSTYLSYLPPDRFAMPLEPHQDERGSFTELIHFGGLGQVSVNISKPGVTKGNHWHHTKTERFIVVQGSGVIRFRKINDSTIIEYEVSADKAEAVDIPPGYTHNITNTGKSDMVTVIWANEIFNKEKPDTYSMEV